GRLVEMLFLMAMILAPCLVQSTSGIDISLFQCEDGVSSDQWSCVASSLGTDAFAIIQVSWGFPIHAWLTPYCTGVEWRVQLGFQCFDMYCGCLGCRVRPCGRLRVHVSRGTFVTHTHSLQCDGNDDPRSVIDQINSYLKGNAVNFGS